MKEAFIVREDWELCDIHLCAFTHQGDNSHDTRKGNVVVPLEVGPDSRPLELALQGDEGDLPEVLQ